MSVSHAEPRIAAQPAALDTRVPMETPEGIDLVLHPAGLLPRSLAFGIDLTIRGVLLAMLYFLLGTLGDFGTGLFLLVLFLLTWGYMVLFEVLHQGRTPGKQLMGLRVIHDDGTPVGWSASVMRNLLRFIDMLPFGYCIGAFTCLQHPLFKRLGDLAAGTLVIYRDLPAQRLQMDEATSIAPPFPLTLEEQRAVQAFAERQGTFSPARAQELAEMLAQPLGLSAPQLAVDELNGIARSLAGAHDANSRMTRILFEERHQDVWRGFAMRLDALERSRGRSDFGEGFSGEYRLICQHLALAADRGYDSRLVEHLQQLAMRGHQQAYRHRSQLAAQLTSFVLAEFPRLVRAEWRWVAIAGISFFGSLMIMALLVYGYPDLVYNIVSPADVAQMHTMYEPAARRIGQSAERASSTDWLMFGYYVMHNVGIAFQTFASGLLLGVGSLFFLFFNGVMIGAVAGHLSDAGLGATFWPFVAGHSAFELTAIMLAGAAGLKLGWALLAPGRLSRGEALRSSARISVRLIGGVMVFLLIAAFVEAYWSSMSWPSPVAKYIVGATLWLLVGTYLIFAGRTPHAPE